MAKPFVDDLLTAGAEGGMPTRGDVSDRAHQSVSHWWMTADGGRTFTSQQHCRHMLGGRTVNRSRKLTGVAVIAGCHGQVSGADNSGSSSDGSVASDIVETTLDCGGSLGKGDFARRSRLP